MTRTHPFGAPASSEAHPGTSLLNSGAAGDPSSVAPAFSGEKLRVLDLFSGIGGFSLGLERTGGFETVAFCEIEAFPRKVLAKHWPKVPCYEDVRELTGAKLAADGIAVDVITGGFPCQDISVAGKQAGISNDTRSGLWSEIARLVGELRPRFVIVENVAALLSGPREQPGGWMGRILGDLAEIGYDAEWHCIPAAYVGAPHRRDRVWIVAYPKQKQRVRAIFIEDNGTESPGVKSPKRREDGLRFKMGSPGGSVSNRWMDKPDSKRVVNGFSDWPYRLGACGNAVVPQVVELIGHSILNTLSARGCSPSACSAEETAGGQPDTARRLNLYPLDNLFHQNAEPNKSVIRTPACKPFLSRAPSLRLHVNEYGEMRCTKTRPGRPIK